MSKYYTQKVRLLHKLDGRVVWSFRGSRGKTISGTSRDLETAIAAITRRLKNLKMNCDIEIVDKKRECHCLKCDKIFISDGPHNRLCRNCRDINQEYHDINGGYASE